MQVGVSGVRSAWRLTMQRERRPGRPRLAPAAEESSKSDKRRILIKRKRADDVPAEEAASLPTVESAGTSGALIDTLVVSPPPAHPHAEAPAVAPC